MPKESVKTPKIETPTTVALPSEFQSSSNHSEQILPNDFTSSKSEDIMLDDGLLNFPLSDEKFLLQEEIFNTTSKVRNGLLLESV